MRRFIVFRRNMPESHVESNAPDEVQIEGVEFTDGTVTIRWCTPMRSTTMFADFQTFMAVHGHPEYETEIEWLEL